MEEIFFTLRGSLPATDAYALLAMTAVSMVLAILLPVLLYFSLKKSAYKGKGTKTEMAENRKSDERAKASLKEEGIEGMDSHQMDRQDNNEASTEEIQEELLLEDFTLQDEATDDEIDDFAIELSGRSDDVDFDFGLPGPESDLEPALTGSDQAAAIPEDQMTVLNADEEFIFDAEPLVRHIHNDSFDKKEDKLADRTGLDSVIENSVTSKAEGADMDAESFDTEDFLFPEGHSENSYDSSMPELDIFEETEILELNERRVFGSHKVPSARRFQFLMERFDDELFENVHTVAEPSHLFLPGPEGRAVAVIHPAVFFPSPSPWLWYVSEQLIEEMYREMLVQSSFDAVQRQKLIVAMIRYFFARQQFDKVLTIGFFLQEKGVADDFVFQVASLVGSFQGDFRTAEFFANLVSEWDAYFQACRLSFFDRTEEQGNLQVKALKSAVTGSRKNEREALDELSKLEDPQQFFIRLIVRGRLFRAIRFAFRDNHCETLKRAAFELMHQNARHVFLLKYMTGASAPAVEGTWYILAGGLRELGRQDEIERICDFLPRSAIPVEQKRKDFMQSHLTWYTGFYRPCRPAGDEDNRMSEAFLQQNFQEFVSSLEKRTLIGPKNVLALNCAAGRNLLARSLIGLYHARISGDLPRAEFYLKAGLKRNPVLLHRLADVSLQLEDYREAEKRYSLLVRRYPDVKEFWHNYGKILKEAGRSDEARLAYGRSLPAGQT